ncbi:MAG: transposase [Nitrosospira sp.]
MYFCGLGLTDDIPDETTLCRFRNRLITAGRLDGLLAGVNIQLQDHGSCSSARTVQSLMPRWCSRRRIPGAT